MKKLFVISILALFLTGCAGDFIRSKVEGGIRHALPGYIGPAKQYTVKADGPATDMLNGHIEALHIQGDDVRIDPRLTLNHLAIDMDDIHYNDKRELTKVGATVFSARVSEDAINRFAAQGQASDYDVQTTLGDNQVEVRATPTALGIGVPIHLVGRPMISGGNKVNFVVNSASAGVLPVPAAVANKILDRMNPILDMSTMKFPVFLDKIVVKSGIVEIQGKAQFKPSIPDSK